MKFLSTRGTRDDDPCEQLRIARLVAAAVEGFGILHILEDLVAAPIADGRLPRLL